MPDTIRIEPTGGDKFQVTIRGHRLVVDQPVDDGGDDTGATPTEMFVASLGACVAFYARRYLARHGLPTEGFGVTVGYTMGSRPARVESMTVVVTVPAGVPEERRAGLLAVASHCTVHNTLEMRPETSITLRDAEAVAA